MWGFVRCYLLQGTFDNAKLRLNFLSSSKVMVGERTPFPTKINNGYQKYMFIKYSENFRKHVFFSRA